MLVLVISAVVADLEFVVRGAKARFCSCCRSMPHTTWMTADLAVNALANALALRGGADTIVHPDRAGQARSTAFVPHSMA